MAISDTARRNHDELFPDHVSTLAVTDLELIEYFDNFGVRRGAERRSPCSSVDALPKPCASP